MADTKVSALTLDTSLDADDLYYVVTDIGGTPLSRAVEVRRLRCNVTTAVRTALSSNPGDFVFDTDLDMGCEFTARDGWVSIYDGLPV